ncbi:MAG: phytase [Pseudomonadales bacterium]
MNTTKALLLRGVSFILFAIVINAQANAEPQNIILFIGDGMGFPQLDATRIFENGGATPLSFEQFPVAGTVSTVNAKGGTTDSAAAATAMATGHKVNNRVISQAIPGAGNELLMALENQQYEGKRTGLVTTSEITDATPAAFGAHENSRYNEVEIADDYFFQTRPNVLFGLSGPGVDFVSAASAGYSVVTSSAELHGLNSATVDYVSGQFAESSRPSLSDMATAAVEILDGPDGFFLLIEHEGTDSHGHDNDLQNVIASVLELRDAVDAVSAWAANRNDTLIIVTADHETGGLTITETSPQPAVVPTHTYSTTGHTGSDVPLYASGPNADVLADTIANTDLFPVLAGLETVAFASGVNGYNLAHDTFMQQDPANADTNNGAQPELNVDSDDPKRSGADVQALLKFDGIFGDAPGQISADAAIISATLELQVTSRGHSLALHRMLQEWNDAATWNSFVDGVQADDFEAQSIAEATTGWVSTGRLQLDVTATLLTWQQDSSSNQGWVLLPTGSNGVDFDSAEGETAPRLVVQTARSSSTPTPIDPAQITVSVTATVETAPVPSSGDSADDAAIWLNPLDAALSRVIGTDKKQGLAVYDLGGNQLQFLPDGRMNSVDLRYGFLLDGALVDIVAATERGEGGIVVYAMNPNTGTLAPVTAGGIINSTLSVYGLCMYKSQASAASYVFITGKKGEVEQWRLIADASGLIDGVLVRSFDVGAKTEGCVADDRYGYLYVGEEDVGIWRYNAEPNTGEERTSVDVTGPEGHLTADIEGLSLYHSSDGGGYLIASSQGSSEYVIYQRDGNHDYVGTFQIADGNGVDGTGSTDGIDVLSTNLGSAFPNGVFVAQDGHNAGANQNFKLVPWETIANAFANPLSVDTGWDPRQ